MRLTTRYVLAIALVCLLGSAYVWPQAGTGELTGLVSDPTGAVVVGAAVELSNPAVGTSRKTVTSTAGVYRFPAVPVGTYALSLQQSGFKAVKIEGIAISVGSTLTRDIRLEVGSPTETITVVSGGPELVQTAESSISTLVDKNIWENMPLEIRNQNKFIELVAGAVPDDMAGNTRGAAVNGARGGAGNYLVEGADNNDQGQAGRGQLSPDDPGGAATSISPDAIAEYRVITNTFAAEYGRAGGFVTDTVMKSGTNQFHGSAYEYNRVQALAAQHFFANQSGQKDSLVRNQFGFSAGGPIVKDKAFFFYTMEWHRMRQSEPLSATGTTQQYLDWVNTGGLQKWAETDPAGVCMQETGKTCVGKFANSAKLGTLFNKARAVSPFPVATSAFSNEGQGFYTTGLIYPVPVYGDVYVQDPTHLNEYRISTKVDYALTNQDQLSVLYLNQTANSGDPYGGGGNTIGPAYTQDGRAQNAAVTWTRSFSPTVINTFKISFLRHRSDYPPPDGLLGIPEIYTYNDPMTVGLGLYGGLPQFFTDNQFQYQDHVSILHGKHSFKTGFEYRRTRNGSSFYNATFGGFYPYGVEDLVTDLAFTDEADMAVLGKYTNGSVMYATAAVNPATGGLPEVYRGFRANEIAMYFQDDWRVSSRLTVNMGMRYEYFGPPHNFRPDIDSNFYFGTTVTPIPTTSTNPFFPKTDPFYAGVATASFQVRNSSIWNKDTNNFAPRLGFAWDMFGTAKLVLRAGAGVMYDRVYNNVFENIRFNPPYFSVNQIGPIYNGVPVGALSTPGLYTIPFSSTGAFAKGYAAKPNPRHMDQNMVSPWYEQYHLGVQYALAQRYVVEAEWVATVGRKLIGYYDINTFNGRVAKGQDTTRISTVIGADNYRNNRFSSDYHAMQLVLRKNYSAGIGFNVNYTWSRALDNLSDLFNGRGTTSGPMDTMNVGLDYGPADFNMTQRFVTTVSYDLPFAKKNRYIGGWSVNTIISLQTGVPFSPYSSSSSYDANKDGRYTDRLYYNGSGGAMDSLTSTKSPADGYFDTTKWARYACPATVNNGLWCNSIQGRGTVTGPAYQNVDFSIQKQFKITEAVTFKLLGNFFNLFNHTNFDLPTMNQGSSSFGKSTATFSPRITQLVARIDF
jgi:hypothetical protein